MTLKETRRWKINELRLQGVTYEKIGALFGISYQRVQQIFQGQNPTRKIDRLIKTMFPRENRSIFLHKKYKNSRSG